LNFVTLVQDSEVVLAPGLPVPRSRAADREPADVAIEL
jgi:hypothetical protein